MMRLLIAAAFAATLTACSTLHLGAGGPPGLKIVGKSVYCGTPSQSSEVHYFADPDSYQNWIDYRNIDDLNAKAARERGVVIVEMGQRPTGGYTLKLDRKKTKIDGNSLNLVMNWHAPRLDAAVSQAMTTQCVAVRPPTGGYSRIHVLDQIGNTRGELDISRMDGSKNGDN